MTLPAKPRGKSAAKYSELHAAAQGELDALRYATDLRNARLADVFEEIARQVDKAKELLRGRPAAPPEAEK